MKDNVKALFQPIRIAGIEIKNRIVMPPMDTCAFNYDGSVSPKLLPYMRNRAKGGTEKGRARSLSAAVGNGI